MNSNSCTTLLTPSSHSYGAALNMMKRNCCYFLNNSSPTIMYPAGRYVASIGVANSENSKKMDFLYLSENVCPH